MKCKVCGSESGKYVLCRDCNALRMQGLIIKCPICNQWHHKDAPCMQSNAIPIAEPRPQPLQTPTNEKFLYEPKRSLMSRMEQDFYLAIVSSVPTGYHVYPQMNLAAFIKRTDHFHYQNELFRNLDFLVTDGEYTPKIAIEINDRSHLSGDRYKRDQKVQHILEEAGIPLLTLWTSYGVNQDYIEKKITELLNTPVVRKHHFPLEQQVSVPQVPMQQVPNQVPNQIPQPAPPVPSKNHGCYIATCVYGSYDCPPVWTLRRYRDETLSSSWHGKLFIKLYYAISPTLVKYFGNIRIIRTIWKALLDRFVYRLNADGYENLPYRDRD